MLKNICIDVAYSFSYICTIIKINMKGLTLVLR